MTQQLVPFRVREYRGESAFVAGTWLRSYLSSPWARRLDPDDYWHHHARLVSSLIDASKIMVAEHIAHEGLLLGFAVGERDTKGPVLHYVAVKNDYRRFGVASACVKAVLVELKAVDGEPVRYTHSRSPGEEIARSRGWQYSQYPAFRYGWDNSSEKSASKR